MKLKIVAFTLISIHLSAQAQVVRDWTSKQPWIDKGVDPGSYELPDIKSYLDSMPKVGENSDGRFEILQHRCKRLSDSQPQQTANGRIAWANKCTQKWYESVRLRKNNLPLDATEEEMTPYRREADRLRNLKRYLKWLQLQVNSGLQSNKYYPTYTTAQRLKGEGDKPDYFRLENPLQYQAPLEEGADCILPEKYMLTTICREGCFAPEQELKTSEGSMQAQEIAKNLMTLAEGSTTKDIQSKITNIKLVLTDLEVKMNEIVDIELSNGETLSVTPNHPLIDINGNFILASDAEGKLLLGEDSNGVFVNKVTGRSHYGKVFNFLMNTENVVENITFASGVLVGTQYHQDQDVKTLNRLLSRIQFNPEK